MAHLSPQHRRLFRIVVPILSVLVFLLVTELVVRLAGVDTYYQNRLFVLNRALDYPDVFQKDHDLFWRMCPNREAESRFFEGRTYRTNDWGLRGGPIGPRKERRILTLGNSCTFGWGLDEADTYPARLQQLVGPGVDVINGGVPGYSSYQGRVFFEEDLHKLEPDIVLVMFGWNDIWAAANGIPDKEQEFPPRAVIAVQNQLSRLHTYRLLKKLLLSPIEQNPDSLFSRQHPIYRVSPEDFAANLRAICREVRESGGVPVLMTAPLPSEKFFVISGTSANVLRFRAAYNQITRDVAGSEDVRLIDLERDLDGRVRAFDNPSLDPMHFNAAANALAAELIAEAIRGIL